MTQSHRMTLQRAVSAGPEYTPYLRQEAEAGGRERILVDHIAGGFLQ